MARHVNRHRSSGAVLESSLAVEKEVLSSGLALASKLVEQALDAKTRSVFGLIFHKVPAPHLPPAPVRRCISVTMPLFSRSSLLVCRRPRSRWENAILTTAAYEDLGANIPTYYAKTYGDTAAMQAYGFNRTGFGPHEQEHTYQYQVLGPLYTLFYLLGHPFSAGSPLKDAADRYGAGQGSWWPHW